jgi:hypothetical protein
LSVPRALLALSAVLATTMAAGCAHSLSAVVPSAALLAHVPKGGDRERDAANAHVAHHVAPGSGSVLLWRDYDGGGGMVSDDETFRKVSLALPSPLPASGEMALGPASDVRVIVGGSAWPRAACEAKAVRAGTLAWKRRTLGGFHVTLDVEVDLRPVAAGGIHQCDRTERIRWTGTVPQRRLEELTAFQGGHAGDDGHIYRETYP